MKTLISKIAFILILQSFANNVFAHVELDYPVGGETFTTGQTVTIQWHIAIAHNTLNWDLFYSPDGGTTWETIQMDLPPGSLSYTWTVPSNVTSQARVSVIQDNSAQDYQDESLNFSIVLPGMPPVIVTGAIDITIDSDVGYQDNMIEDWLDYNAGATANGFCGDLVWTNDFTSLSDGCGSTGSALVTFTATDPCGSTETVSTITVQDTSPPYLTATAIPITVQCDGNGNVTDFNNWLQMNGGAIAYDYGGSVTWGVSYIDVDSLCSSGLILTMLFTAIDECDNTVTTEATFTIADHEAPAIQTPAIDIGIDCHQPDKQVVLQNWLLNHGGAIASDLCGNVSWTNNFPVLPDTCNGLITEWTVLFTASDDCGNIDSTTAVVTLFDALSGTSGSLSEVGLTISPNPVKDILRVEVAEDGTTFERVTLFDAYGHSVLVNQERANDLYIDVSGFTPGLYFLLTETSNGVGTRKVIIE